MKEVIWCSKKLPDEPYKFRQFLEKKVYIETVINEIKNWLVEIVPILINLTLFVKYNVHHHTARWDLGCVILSRYAVARYETTCLCSEIYSHTRFLSSVVHRA